MYSHIVDRKPISNAELTENIKRTLEPDYEFLAKVTDDDAKSLEAILHEGQMPSGTGDLVIGHEQNPSLIHVSQKFPSPAKFTPLDGNRFWTGGNAYVFHNKGFVLLNYHALVDHPSINIKDTKVILHDPIKRIVRNVQVLAYSKNYDLALGKIDAPEGLYQNSPPLLAEPVFPQVVYARTIDNTQQLMKKTHEKVKKALDGDTEYQASLNIPAEDLLWGFVAGRVVNGVEHDNRHVIKAKSGMRYFEHRQVSVTPDGTPTTIRGGNSGSPVFMSNGLFVGILSQVTGPLDDQGKTIPKYVITSGPTAIRSFLHSYVSHCTQE